MLSELENKYIYKFSTESVAVTIYLLLLGETFKTYDHIENIWVEITAV